MIMLIPNIPCVVLAVLIVMPAHAQWNYPPTKTVEVSDTYFGKTYPDPYRWLEAIAPFGAIPILSPTSPAGEFWG